MAFDCVLDLKFVMDCLTLIILWFANHKLNCAQFNPYPETKHGCSQNHQLNTSASKKVTQKYAIVNI